MTKRVLAALALLLIAGLATAEWQQVGRGNGSAQVSILEQTSGRTVFEVNVPGVELVPVTTDAGEYTRLELPGEVMATIEVGRPQVPKVSVLLAIPNGARVTARATVLGTRTLKVDNVYPLQPPLLECEDEAPFTIDEQFYSRDVSFPGHDVSVIETGVWRDLHVANLQVYPAQVNAARGEVTVASRIRVEVDYSGGSYPAVISENLIPQYGRFIDNFSQLPVRPQVDYEDGIRYLVFCHSDWSSNSWLVDSLLGWVQKRGYDVRMITKSSFTYAEVKDSIRQEYNRHTPPTLEHVLLVGEYAQIPTGTYSGVGKSDFYYMDLEPSPSGDNYPEVSVARFSPSSAADLENQIKKSLKYQKDPATTNNWLEKLTFVAHREQYPGKYSGCVRGAYHMPKPYWQPTLDTIMGQFTGNASVTSAVNAGVGILAYRGHGDATEWWSWGTDGSWYNSHVAALSNGDLTPVTQHWACICGDISVSESHIESWMRKYPGGAVSALGATQASYTYPNHGQCSTLVRATCDTWTITVPGVRDYAGPVFKVADQMSYMDAYLAKYWPGSPYYYNIWMYLTLGDPSMPVWAGGMPQAASVTAPDSIPLGPYAMNVTVQVGGRPVAGALVCAWKDGDFYTTGRTDGTGLVVLDVNAGTAGDVWLTISEGHAASTPHTPILPWEGIVPAGGGGTPQPNMRYVSNQVDDAGGNNNGRFDPGETADIIVTVRNAGNAAAQNVTGLLASGSVLFTITDPNSNFGTVPAGSTATNDADRFTAMADNSIPGGTMVPCTLHLHSDNWGDWTYTFTLQVGEPPVPGQYMITLDTGSVRLSVCGIGSIGYDEPPSDLGSGFQVPRNAASCLFFGGLMAGNSASYLVDHHYSQPASSGTNHDWAMTDSFRIVIPPSPADVQWVNTMSDAGHPSAKGLTVEQRWYMNADGEYDDWAIGVFDFENEGSAAINGLYAGMIGDFDVGSTPTANYVYSDTVRRSIWMRQSTQNPTAGYVLLDPPVFGNLTAVDHAVYVYPDSCMTDGQKWKHLDGTVAMRQSNRAYDWSLLASAGPFDLPVGATQRVAFAVVGASSEAGFLAAGDSAQSWYNNMTGIVHERKPLETATADRPFFLRPNPFRGGTFVHYYSPLPGNVELAAFDATGREVERVVFEAGQGSGRYFWQPKSLARGIYFLKVKTPARESVAKVLLMD